MQYRFFCNSTRKINHFRTRLNRRDTQSFIRLSELPEHLESRRTSRHQELRLAEDAPGTKAKTAIRKMLAKCSKPPDPNRAIHCLRTYEHEGHPPDLGLYTAVMSVCAKGSEVVATSMLLAELKEKGLKPNVVTYSTLMTAYARHLRGDKVKDLLKEMRREKVRPNLIVYGGALNCFAKAGLHLDAIDLMKNMKRDTIQPDQMIHSSMVEAYLRSSNFNEAVEYFEKVKDDENCPADLVMYNVAINACGKGKRGDQAIQYLRELQSKGMNPSTLTYNQVIDALVRSGLTRKAFEVFEEMRIKRMEIHGATFATLINGCSSPDLVHRAIQLFQLCKSEFPHELDDILYFSIIDVLHMHGMFNEVDAIYLHAYRSGKISHWFPSKDSRFDLHEFTSSGAAAALRCGFAEIYADFENRMLDELSAYGPEVLQEPLGFPAAKRGVEILAWRAETEAGDLVPATMLDTIQETLAFIDVNLEAEATDEDEYLLWVGHERIYKMLHAYMESSKTRWLEIVEQRRQRAQEDDEVDAWAWDLIHKMDHGR